MNTNMEWRILEPGRAKTLSVSEKLYQELLLMLKAGSVSHIT